MGRPYYPNQLGPDGLDLGWMPPEEYQAWKTRAEQETYVQKTPGSKKRVHNPQPFSELDPNGEPKYELGSKSAFAGLTRKNTVQGSQFEERLSFQSAVGGGNDEDGMESADDCVIEDVAEEAKE
jgi:hypothetical protein